MDTNELVIAIYTLAFTCRLKRPITKPRAAISPATETSRKRLRRLATKSGKNGNRFRLTSKWINELAVQTFATVMFVILDGRAAILSNAHIDGLCAELTRKHPFYWQSSLILGVIQTNGLPGNSRAKVARDFLAPQEVRGETGPETL